ncbi:MAG TPA: hypothetical protein VF774_09695 [Pseudoduganella sp.]
MRRVFVIFLILLFPLNVLALSLSVSSMQPAGSTQSVFAPAPADVDAGSNFDSDSDSFPAGHFAGAPDSQSTCDIDPDEPPSGTDFHDWVSREAQSQPVVLPEESISSLVPPRRGLSPFPPIKPPPRI